LLINLRSTPLSVSGNVLLSFAVSDNKEQEEINVITSINRTCYVSYAFGHSSFNLLHIFGHKVSV